MSNEPPRKRTRFEHSFKKSNLKHAVRAAREDFDPPFPDDDKDTDDERESEYYEPDPDPEGDLEIAAGTRANTRLNTGYSSPFGQYIARTILVDLRHRWNLPIIALQGQDPSTQQNEAEAVATTAQDTQQSSDANTAVESVELEDDQSRTVVVLLVILFGVWHLANLLAARIDRFPPIGSLVIFLVIFLVRFAATNMTENQAPGAAGGADAPGGMPFYEQSRAELKEMLTKRRDMAKKLAAIEDTIYTKETEYLESTPNGNVLTGFEPLIKGGTTAAAAQRRKVPPLELHRVFSRSSISYNANMSESNANTPGSSHAPTPVSSTFAAGGSGSNHPTPTSGAGSGSNAGKTGGASRKEKRKGLSLDAGGDSESDANLKKVRTNFGAARK
ncbi:hypothetical protein SLS53_003188 [Cytospora paraplurivora]|uniref:Chromatin modification-related protein EAF6 n=1 Tax=Cytospora paraplurivora TaxID=2898453 RepID=A0AAN9UEM1_9PEZI